MFTEQPESAAGKRRFLRTAVSAVSGLCSWLCHTSWEVVALGDTIWDITMRDFLGRFWLMHILGFTTVQPWTKPVFFQFLQKQNCQQVFGEKGIVQGLHQVFLNILLTTWNTSGWDTSGSLLSRHLSKCAFLQSETALPKPQKSWDLKILRDGDDATSQRACEGIGKKGESWDVNREGPK